MKIRPMPAPANVSALVGDIPNNRLPMKRDNAIEANVRRRSHNLKGLVSSIGQAADVVRLRSFGSESDPRLKFDDGLGPPWQGEWENKSGD